ncbi:MAG: protein kinase [Kofleriaceae bacterium]
MLSRQAIELGPYQLFERIGEGGSGQVFRATGPSGPVAVKMLGPASMMDDAARARFPREIAALAQIHHPNLVRMLDHGIDTELGPYLVLPMLAGTNLRALCAGGAICPEAALLLVQPIVHATAALHAAGYTHRDLKPENAIAAPDGTVTVIDLGLAWRDGMTQHTETGTVVGSVGYMAPEQIEGGTVSPSADVWALGVMLYEMIAGKRPFSRTRPAEEAAAALLGNCPRLAAADRRAGDELSRLVARCLTTDAAARPTTAELATTIDAMIDWTAAIADERAAVVAAPTAYQARVAAFRIGRIERLAREAIDAGKPFEALTACDRGLAYEPAHAGLLALVAAAESATVPSGEIQPASGSVPVAHAPTAASPIARRRLVWLAAAALAVVVIVGVSVRMFASEPGADAPAAPDPWGDRADAAGAVPARAPSPAEQKQASDKAADNIGMVKDFVSLFGRAMASSDHHEATKSKVATEDDKQIMRDMLKLFGRVAEHPDAKPQH